MEEKEVTSVVTSKGQVTIPAEIRQQLGIKPHDRVVFRIAEGGVYLTAVKETIESVYGAVTPLQRPEDWQARRDEAIADHATRTVQEMAADERAPET